MNALEFAINMELDGERYYRKQVLIYKDTHLYPVCQMLAEDEKYHALLLSNKLSQKPFELKGRDTLQSARNIFQGRDFIDSPEKEIPSQLDFYQEAAGIEKQSIELYRELAARTEDAEEKDLYDYLIGQEEEHNQVLEELALLLRHAEEWVESAEFGNREEY